MRCKPLLVAVPVLLLGAHLVAPADARPSAATPTFAWDYIHQPCTSAYVLDSGASPVAVYCTSVAGGRACIDQRSHTLADGTVTATQLGRDPDVLQRHWNQGFFLTRGLSKVKAEMSLTVLAYDIQRVVKILEVPRMIEALG